MHPRTPVLVGAAAIRQKLDDPDAALEPVALMARALEAAAEDAGSQELLRSADSIRIPRGIWAYRDPARLVARQIGASRAQTHLAQIGVLQTTPLGAAARDIQEGREDIVLVTGGEAKWRSTCALRAGRAERLSDEPADAEPDHVQLPAKEIMHPLEMEQGLAQPVAQYAMLETALRYAEGRSPEAHARYVAEVWAGLSRGALDNPCAWRRELVPPERILEIGDRNRMLAYPYAKLHNSQWNVDQAAGLIFCSLERARALGIDERRFVYPCSVAESNHIVTVVERAELARCPGFACAAQRGLEAAALRLEDIDHLELYSCFPVAVEMQLREIGLSADRLLSVTGGMAFAGGPLNNFVLQAVARMADVLRADRGSTGMVTAVSTIVTKQGVGLWSTSPPEKPFAFLDVTDEVAERSATVVVDPKLTGDARIAAYTVLYGGAGPERAVAACDTPDGRRTLASTTQPALMASMVREEFCGRAVRVADNRFEVLS